MRSVFEGNKKWVENKISQSSNYFSNLSKGQTPEILFIGCSDSRVAPELMLGLEPGNIFVHRNIANLVPNNDINSASVISYAVKHLKVDHVVVCGHYFCGGVKAAMSNTDLGIINPWLKNIRDVYRLHQKTLDNIKDENDRYNKLIELNVLEQCINLIKNEDIQRAIRKRKLKLHAWIFDISSGKLIDLKIDINDLTGTYKRVYEIK